MRAATYYHAVELCLLYFMSSFVLRTHCRPKDSLAHWQPRLVKRYLQAADKAFLDPLRSSRSLHILNLCLKGSHTPNGCIFGDISQPA